MSESSDAREDVRGPESGDDLDAAVPLEPDWDAAGLAAPSEVEPRAAEATGRRRLGPLRWLAVAVLATGPAVVVAFVRMDAVAPLEAEAERAIADPMRVRAGEVRAPSQLASEIEAGHRRAWRDGVLAGGLAFVALAALAVWRRP